MQIKLLKIKKKTNDIIHSVSDDKCLSNFNFNISSKRPKIRRKKNIKEIKIEKDLGVYVHDNLKFERQINDSVRKANNMVRIIKHTFTYLDSKSLSILYKTYIRPHLEYCVQAWSPYLHKDVDKLESVQRSVTKLLPNFKNLPCHQRLAELGLKSQG